MYHKSRTVKTRLRVGPTVIIRNIRNDESKSGYQAVQKYIDL